MSLLEALEHLRGAPKISLNEKYIDDKGAKDLAKFLQAHGKVQLLELKSNDITGIGFADLFRALLRNPLIRQIIIQHNRLGEEDEDQWLYYFNQLVDKSPKLERMNFSNNKISSRTFASIRSSLSKSKTIKLLQLRYNQISSSEISSFVNDLHSQKNQILLFVQLAGNKIQRDILSKLEAYLKHNRQKNPIPKDNLMMTGGFYAHSRQDPGFHTQSSFTRNNAVDDLSKQNVLRHLENLLDQARRGTAQMKNKLQGQLVDIQRRQKLDAQEIVDLDRKCNELTISNRNLNYQIQRTIMEHRQIQQDIQFQNRVKQQKILQANRQLTQMQAKYQEIQNKMVREHQSKLRQLSRLWETRVRSVEERIRSIQGESNSVDAQIYKIKQKRQKLRNQYEQEEAILRNRIEEQQSQRYRFKIQNLLSRITDVEESRERFYKRGEEIIYQFESNQTKTREEISKLQEEVESNKIKEKNLVDQNKELVKRNESIKQEISLKEITIQKLQEQINRINEEIQLKKAHNREQIDKIIEDHQYERTKRDGDKQSQIQRLNDLEGTLRNYRLENAKLVQQYKILQHKLQISLSKAVQEVFTDTNLY